jgi:hypothetical protein
MTIRVSPQVFDFTSKNASLRIRTFLYLENGSAGSRVLSVGEETVTGPDIVRVELFGEAQTRMPVPRSVDRLACLEAFVRYGILKVTSRRAMVRPCITVGGIDTLDPMLHGYQVGLLRNVLTSSGASMVVIEGHDAV